MLVAGLLLTLSLGMIPNRSEGSKIMQKTVQLNLWQVIDQIGARQPIRREPVEQLLHTKLVSSDASNPYFTFWNNHADGPIALHDGTQIKGVELRTGNDDASAPGALTLTLAGTCVSRQDVKARFAGITLTGAPTGQSLDEETTFSTPTSWGELVFGFAERNPDCLSSIGFGAKPE